MKKSRFLWAGIVLAAIVVVLALFFLGRAPFPVPVWSVLPAVDESMPHLLLVGEGEDMPSRDLLDPLEVPFPLEPLRDWLVESLPLLGRAERYALLLFPEEGILEVYGAFYPDREDLASLNKGELPDKWAELSPRSGIESRDGDLVLSIEGQSRSFKLRPKGRMVLISYQAEGLDRMTGILEGRAPGLDVSWAIHPEWSSHLRVYDAGHLGDILFMGGFEVGTTPLSAEVSWRNGPEGHDLAWKCGGVGDLLSEWGFPEKGFPEVWSRSMTLPSPSLLTLGVVFPPEFLERFSDSLQPDWAQALGFSPTQSDALLSGPMVFSLGGRSKLFLFSAPGVYLQLFDRGDLGRELVDRLWNVSWSSLVERRKALEGFPFGGGVSRPFSLVGAARDDRAIVGLLDPLEVAEERTPARVLPFDPGGSFLWFYGDFPELASTLKKWARLGEYAGSVGFDVGEMGDTFERIESLRSMGRLSLVLQSPFEGWASWTGDNR